MHANAKRLPDQERNHISELQPVPSPDTLGALVLRFMRLLRLAFWRAFQHDAFAIAKASAYSSILTFFPLLLVVGSVLATSHKTEAYLREISYAVGRILPAGSGTALAYLKGSAQRPVVKERLIAFSLVILAGTPLTFATVLVAFGSRIEARVIFHLNHEYSYLILFMWTVIRWLIAGLTSIAVIALIYHNAVPRTQPWHSVLPGATLATAVWFAATALFGWYLQRYADYSIIYGSLGVGIALLVWMYMISLIILVGAEFNAMIFPRSRLGQELVAMASRTLTNGSSDRAR